MISASTAISRGNRLLRAFRRRTPAEFAKLCLRNTRLLLSGGAARYDYVHDDAWDRLHGVQTAGSVEIDEITAPQRAQAGAVRYEATPPDCFAHLVGAADLGPRSGYTFIDIGSGKGRVILMAALAGFQRVVGVEFGEELHRAACRNVALMRGRIGAAKVEPVRADAACYDFPPEPIVCFLNNPFGADLLDRVLDRIEASLAADPRAFTLIYYHSNHADRLDVRPAWELVAKGAWQDESHHFAIYRARAE